MIDQEEYASLYDVGADIMMNALDMIETMSDMNGDKRVAMLGGAFFRIIGVIGFISGNDILPDKGDESNALFLEMVEDAYLEAFAEGAKAKNDPSLS